MKKLQVVRGDVWKSHDVVAAAQGAKSRMFCVAYVTQAHAGLFRSGDVLVCDASRKAVSCGETDPKFLLELLKKGVEIYSCEALHAKCAVFDDVVLLGSANMSESSANRLIELSLLARNSSLACDVQAFIEKQKIKPEAKLLSEKDLERLSTVWRSERKPWQVGLPKQNQKRPRRGLANHVITTYIANSLPRSLTQEDLDSSEEKAKKRAGEIGNRELSYYWTSGSWNARKPKDGDRVIMVTYSSSKKNATATVCGPGTVVWVDKKKKTRIVHYLKPRNHIAYSKFRRKFDLGKTVNQYCKKDDRFELMVDFIKQRGR